MEENTLLSLLALHRVLGFANKSLLQLLARFPSPNVVFSCPASRLYEIGVSQDIVKKITEYSQSRTDSALYRQVRTDLSYIKQSNTSVITINCPSYPSLLKEIACPPAILYLQGNTAFLNAPQIAIVGSRNCSRAGAKTAYDFAEALARQGLGITSGLALGIDGQAHQGAMAAGMATTAVLANGIDQFYPARHKALSAELSKKGLLVSEFPIGTRPLKGFFPRRNRIISGLSLGTLVVEASIKSGSLITARLAMEQNREVFAVPSSIHNPQSKGCHRLIQQGAKLTQSIDDIVEELPCLASGQQSLMPAQPEPLLDVDLSNFLDCLDFDVMALEQIIAISAQPLEQILVHLTTLEVMGRVERVGAGFRRLN